MASLFTGKCNIPCFAGSAGLERTAWVRRDSASLIQMRRKTNALHGFLLSTEKVAVNGASNLPSRMTCQAMGDGGGENLEENDVFMGLGDSETPLKICQVHTLSTALTLSEAVEKLQSAIADLKSNSPSVDSGILRFQVPLPQGIKALDWLQCQPQSHKLFPTCYFSPKSYGISFDGLDKEISQLQENTVRGAAGVGSAVMFKTFNQFSIKDWKAIRRFLSTDSPLIRVYGSICFTSDMEPSCEWLGIGSFYFVVPQIEFNEYENSSLLAATVAWDHSLLWTLKKSICKLELSLSEVSCQVAETGKGLHLKGMTKNHVLHHPSWKTAVQELSKLSKSSLSKDIKSFSYSEAGLERDSKSSSKWQEHQAKASQQLQQLPNINAVWAFLIIEECCRLGITYFCIAPGSRSSALAVAAAENPHATCISCIDERSLGFHALGYARGSHKPAAVITSSGTAVSNLLPSVVEASQDHVPLLFITASSPLELHDTGASQAINQVNHFGSFVRYFHNLPPPDDKVPARMVLTTLDTAVFKATRQPYGPVHLNCEFREPLAGFRREWNLECLKGLDRWTSKPDPFTKYIQVTQFHPNGKLIDIHDQYKEVMDLIQGASRGLLVIGSLQTAEETHAAFLLGRHLGWPIVPDILSGLRLKNLISTVSEAERNLYFVEHLEHILLSNTVKQWLSPDVVVHVGSRFTSKRINQFLADCRPDAYIMVANHPHRHDPSHIVTHRIQTSVVGFAATIRELHIPKETKIWCKWLQAMNSMVEWEISFQLNAECLLTEPYVAWTVSQSLSPGSALFLGNSMPVRDVNAYGVRWSKLPRNLVDDSLDASLPILGVRVAGNRGAGGIDGVLSTAIGYAAGSNQRVVFMVGDLSFLHDTNGLSLLKERMVRSPITIVVTNNKGGAIFSLLPIADTAPRTAFRNLFQTPHDVSIRHLSLAHRVKHMLVRTKEELQTALRMSEEGKHDWVIEVESNLEENAAHHRFLQKSVNQAVDHAFNVLSRYSENDNVKNSTSGIHVLKMEYSRYRIPLCAPLTTDSKRNQSRETQKEGFLLTLFLDNGKKGFGEVAPLGLEDEDMLDVEEQLRFLVHRAQNMTLNYLMLFLNDSFHGWIWRDIGIPASSLFPSVRCGMEMGVLSALAATKGGNIADLLLGTKTLHSVCLDKEESTHTSRSLSSKVHVCAYLDSEEHPEEIACAAENLVKQGFRTIKVKVARRSDPLEDVAVIQAVRRRVGQQIEICADANRKWTYAQAMQFATGVKDCNLQYIEEPVELVEDITRFCEESDMFVALDETIDDIADELLHKLAMFTHPRIVATVVKPSHLGGFERAALIAKWANKHGKMPVVSAAFESSVSLAVYAQFACFIDNMNIRERASDIDEPSVISHGLGTCNWLHNDVINKRLQFQMCPKSGRIEVDANDAAAILQNMEVNPDTVEPSCITSKINSYTATVVYNETKFSFHVMDTGINDQMGKIHEKTLIFLHGFLGTGEDWLPIMQALSITARCISIDLPGHGKTRVQKDDNIIQNNGNAQYPPSEVNLTDKIFSIEVLAEVLSDLICKLTEDKVVIVGYSMGARIALYMALKCNRKISATAIISGSPGLQDPEKRIARSAQDDTFAELLLNAGLPSFIEMWYKGEKWESLRSHPYFGKMIQGCIKHGNLKNLAKALSSLSAGRQPSLWEDLCVCRTPLLVIVGNKDSKFKKIAQQMCFQRDDCIEHGEQRTDQLQQITMLEVADSGHAVHLENPLPVINAIRKFIIRTSCQEESILTSTGDLQLSMGRL